MDIGPARRRLTAEPLDSPVPGRNAPEILEPAAADDRVGEHAGRPTDRETAPTA